MNIIKAWKSTIIGTWLIIGAIIYIDGSKSPEKMKTLVATALIGGGIKLITGDDLKENKKEDVE